MFVLDERELRPSVAIYHADVVDYDLAGFLWFHGFTFLSLMRVEASEK
jgi:hypothetical protein